MPQPQESVAAAADRARTRKAVLDVLQSEAPWKQLPKCVRRLADRLDALENGARIVQASAEEDRLRKLVRELKRRMAVQDEKHKAAMLALWRRNENLAAENQRLKHAADGK